jgi:hypothetical protein
VIARPRGSMPEIVRPGVTGFLVNDTEAAIDAVHAAGRIDRAECRADTLARFSADRMVDSYERLFASMVGSTTPPPRSSRSPLPHRG